LYNGSLFVGVLVSLDGNMNIVLEKAEEFEGDDLKNKYGIIYLRGNNVYFISSKKTVKV
jgi:U6 snRNA-associated Sm-like protein LSm6